MKKIILPLVSMLSLGAICFAPKMRSAHAAPAPGSTNITINRMQVDFLSDGLHRMKIQLFNEENVTVLNSADGLRNSGAYTRPSVCFNGTDYQFTGSDLFAAFAQTQESGWTMYLRYDASNTSQYNANDPSKFYRAEYPGFPNAGDNYIKFYKDSIFGTYKLTNDFIIYVNRSTETSYLITNPVKVNVTNGTIDGAFSYEGSKCCNAGTRVTVTPNEVMGKVASGLKITNTDGQEINIDVTKNTNGTFSFEVPNQDINVEVLYKEITYKIYFGDTSIEVVPFSVIGNIPDGRWAIDGFEISSDSIYVWKEDKVATRLDDEKFVPTKTYTLTLMVDEEIYKVITFTNLDKNITLPPVPYKGGYRIIGWDITTVNYENTVAHAIYEKL